MSDRWEPKDLDELRSFIANGGASETRFYDFKRQLPSNKEVAKKLAGFAIEGGALVFGVAEPESGQFEVRPIAHAGLREKVAQIAQSRVDPPVDVDPVLLKDPDDDSLGVLWVRVPESPEAPHQVGGVYYERGDTETRPMKDGAVERLIRARRRTLEDIQSELQELMANDPIVRVDTAHVVAIARPVRAAEQELYEAIGGDSGWWPFCQEARSRIKENARTVSQFHEGCRPWLRCAVIGASAPGRYRLRSYYDGGARNYYPILEMSFWEDGTIHYFNNQATDLFAAEMAVSDTGASEHEDIQFLSPTTVVGSCLDVVDAARAVARRTGRHQAWDVALGVSGTKGLRVEGPSVTEGHRFPDSGYASARRVTHRQLEGDAWSVAHALTRRFVEGCGFTFEALASQMGHAEPTDSP